MCVVVQPSQRAELGLDSLEGLTPDEVADRILQLLDKTDDGAKPAAVNNSATMAALDDFLALERVNACMGFMRANNLQMPAEFAPAYQEITKDMKDAISDRGENKLQLEAAKRCCPTSCLILVSLDFLAARQKDNNCLVPCILCIGNAFVC